MNLSRFYKTHDKFEVKPVLNRSTDSLKEPIWESIVKPHVEPDIPEVAESTNQENEIPIPPEIINEEIIENKPAAEIPVEPPANVPEPEPSIDIELIRENAFVAGVEAGRKQAEDDFENSAQTFLRVCNELDQVRETILKNSSEEMRKLVLAISEKVIRHSVAEQDKTIIATIKDAIHLAIKSDAFQIQINPDDLKAVTAHKKEIIDSVSGLDNIVLKPDATVERGGCKLESECCTVDASMTSQIKVIHDSVLANVPLMESTSSVTGGSDLKQEDEKSTL